MTVAAPAPAGWTVEPDAVHLAGLRVRAYRNLHIPGIAFSVMDTGCGRVVARSARVDLVDVTLTVQPAGRRRTRAEGRRCVHAFAVGTIATPEQWSLLPQVTGRRWRPGTYRPFEHDQFVDARSGAPLLHVRAVALGPWGLRYLA